MTSKFITNQEKLLSDVINNIVPSSENLYFLVGYFYFSGFSELYKKIRDKKVKLLIGLEIEQVLNNRLIEFSQIKEESRFDQSNQARKEDFYNSLVKLINKTDFCDTSEKRKAFRIFLEKIHDGTLEIKKTKEANHAKLYIFENKKDSSQDGEYPGTVITGSSNLTRSGLKDRFEINVISREGNDYEKAKKEIFDKLWEKSIPLADKYTLKEFTNKVTKKVYIDKIFNPYLLYARVLLEYFSTKGRKFSKPSEITKNRYFNLKYQTDAIIQGMDFIERHNGVIVADVVGLGKSIVASTIAHNLNLETIIIAPPHLKNQWKDYRRNFEFRGEIYNSGSIHKALKDYEDHNQEKLIIVDEAHKYRNELTWDYKNLHQLCQGNKVILLTATPFNNKPQDIFSMIKLFQIPARSTIRTVNNLSSQFRNLIREYKKITKIKDKQEQRKKIEEISEKIRGLLIPLVIRRSRLDLEKIDKYRKDLKKQNIEFPVVKPPKMLKYSLGNIQEKYVSTLEKIMEPDNGFEGARYKPIDYLKNREKYKQEITKFFGDVNLFRKSQVNLADFMKKLLVHRFESSMFAFGTTLDKMIISMERIKEWHQQKGKIPIYKKGEIPDVKYLEDEVGDIEEILEDLKDQKGLWFVNSKEVKAQFLKDLENDQSILRKIRQDWFGEDKLSFDLGYDPKIEYFKNKLSQELNKYPDRKIIIFSEYADTVNYVFEKLKNDFRIFNYTSQKANEDNKKRIQENFDADLAVAKQKNDIDVLIATDAISEGYNLHRAGIIFNYDIPYNPTRVIQRVGRINRISKKVFDELFIYNFFPSLIGEQETRIKKVSTLKIDMINALLGSDTRVLTKEEELVSFYKEEYEKAKQNEEKISWDVKFRNEFDHLLPEIKKQAKEIPQRVRIRRTESKDKNYQGVIVFAKKGQDYIFKFAKDVQEPVSLTPEKALELFQADKEEQAKPISKKFEIAYQNLKNNLFNYLSDRNRDKADQDTIKKIKQLMVLVPEEKEYLEDLEKVIFELESLNDRDKKFIRSLKISQRNKKINEKAAKEIKEQIPISYLKSIIQKATDIEEGKEMLILSEEII